MNCVGGVVSEESGLPHVSHFLLNLHHALPSHLIPLLNQHKRLGEKTSKGFYQVWRVRIEWEESRVHVKGVKGACASAGRGSGQSVSPD